MKLKKLQSQLCILIIVTLSYLINFSLDGATGYFWTNGKGDPMCPSKYRWCPSNTILGTAPGWLPNKPDHWDNKEWCISVELQNVSLGLEDSNCNDIKPYICEVS